MGKALAIDWGQKRTGLAISDPLKMIANQLDTIETSKLLPFLVNNIATLDVDTIVIGYPKDLQNRPTHATPYVEKLINDLKQHFHHVQYVLIDERFSSKIAHQTILQLGISKKKRQQKQRIDQISALIILQDYLGR